MFALVYGPRQENVFSSQLKQQVSSYTDILTVKPEVGLTNKEFRRFSTWGIFCQPKFFSHLLFNCDWSSGYNSLDCSQLQKN